MCRTLSARASRGDRRSINFSDECLQDWRTWRHFCQGYLSSAHLRYLGDARGNAFDDIVALRVAFALFKPMVANSHVPPIHTSRPATDSHVHRLTRPTDSHVPPIHTSHVPPIHTSQVRIFCRDHRVAGSLFFTTPGNFAAARTNVSKAPSCIR